MVSTRTFSAPSRRLHRQGSLHHRDETVDVRPSRFKRLGSAVSVPKSRFGTDMSPRNERKGASSARVATVRRAVGWLVSGRGEHISMCVERRRYERRVARAAHPRSSAGCAATRTGSSLPLHTPHIIHPCVSRKSLIERGRPQESESCAGANEISSRIHEHVLDSRPTPGKMS